MRKLFHSPERDKDRVGLWTKDFTILISGSFVSLAGSFTITIALGLLILDLTGSSMLYAIQLAISNVAGVIVPLLAASLIDHVSKRRMIYLLDFATAGSLLLLLVVYHLGYLSGISILAYTALLGIFSNTYRVVYQSFFPQVVDKSVYSKAYSVESFVSTIAETGTLIGTACYKMFGVDTVVLVSAFLYFLAACFETRIEKEDRRREMNQSVAGFEQFKRDIVEGLRYVRATQGLLPLTVLGFFTYFAEGALFAIAMPYFKFTFSNGEYFYMIVMSFWSTGQFWGSMINYRIKIPENKRYAFFFGCKGVQLACAAAFLFVPLWGGAALMFLFGALLITTYSIQSSVIYATLSDEMYARYSGLNQTMTMAGYVAGNLLGGVFLERFTAAGSLLLINGFVIAVMLLISLSYRGKLKTLFCVQTRGEAPQ